MRFIFINRFYWPDESATAQLLTDLAEKLVELGHTVTVITSGSSEASARSARTHRGVELRRTGNVGTRPKLAASKLASFLIFSCSALARLAVTARRGDVVVALTDPPLIGIGTWLVARLKRARIFHWVHDIYPEVAVAITGRAGLNALRPLRNLAWRHSDGCMTLGDDLAATLQRSGVSPSKIRLSPNWAPTGLAPYAGDRANPLRSDWNLAGKFIALYAGNLGRVHDLAPLLDVAEHLRAHPSIALVFVGGGAQLVPLQAAAAYRQLSNVHFYPAQPRDRLGETLALGDVHFVTLRHGCEAAVFPSKLYGVAAVGRPVVVIAPPDAELSRLVVAHGFGRAFVPSETQAIADHLLALSKSPDDRVRQARAALAFSGANGGVDRAARDWVALADPAARP